MAKTELLTRLQAGARLLVAGNRVLTVSEELAHAFREGDELAVVQATGEVLHIPAQERAIARDTVTRARAAFEEMRLVSDEQVSQFFELFAENLANPRQWAEVAAANAADVAEARQRGRSTTRLEATQAMRQGMIDGLRGWARAASSRGRIIETIDHGSWRADLITAELGVVAFIFEGRPNVVADATGVLRGGNTVCFRIGRDALGTARAILGTCVSPALRAAGLPEHAVQVVDSSAHAAGWALFLDSRLSLAVARGSGPAVATLGSLAQSAGVPVSLHGTGGAWLVAGLTAEPEDLEQNVVDSLDRKVCNTLNTCCIPERRASELVPALLRGLERAAARRETNYKLHVAEGSERFVPAGLFSREVAIGRAEGSVLEKQAESIAADQLGREWEWENSPEVTLQVVPDVARAIELFNAQSPQFVACLLSSDAAEAEDFFSRVNAPFVGDGFTRWVDGQYALNKPELGLSNWENGRLFGRAGVLSGDSVFSIRTRVTGTRHGRPSDP